MTAPVRLSFSGYLGFEWPNLREQQPFLLARLQEQSQTIAREIAERISESIGAGPPPNVSIDFAEGSIQWFGFVQWVRDAWPAIEVMATVGGAINLIQIVKSAIDGVLRRWFSRTSGPQPFVFYPSSQVVLITAPVSASGPLITGVQNRLFGIAAIITSIAALVAALGWFMRVVAR